MKNGNCKECKYSDNCYLEECYSQMKNTCEDFVGKTSINIVDKYEECICKNNE